jgi:transposase
LLSTVHISGDDLTRHRLRTSGPGASSHTFPSWSPLATMIDTWWPEINAFIATKTTNARTEGYNRLVKTVKRVGCGFRNPDNSHAGYNCTPPAPSVPQPRLHADSSSKSKSHQI